MRDDIAPAITIILREIPRRLVISSDDDTVSFASEGDVIGVAEISQTRLQNVCHSPFTNDTFDVRLADTAGKNFKINRSGNDVSVTIDNIAINFGGDEEASVILGPGLHLLLAFIRGNHPAKGSVTVDGIGTAEMEIAEGANSDFATIKIRA